MYFRAVYADTTISTLRQFIRDNPLGILTTAIPSQLYPLLQCSHIPFILDIQNQNDEAELGVLRGHIARQNPQSKAMVESLQSAGPNTDNVLSAEVMVLFNSPVQHYVTPQFYTETKPNTGKVAPTWNYAAVQAYGKAKIYYDSKSEETGRFLAAQIDDLSRHGEEYIMGYTGTGGERGPWKVSDAPENYIQLLRKNIVGIEITIGRLEGKFKMTQERGVGDREGVIKGFQSLGSEMGRQMAGLVKERGELKDSESR